MAGILEAAGIDGFLASNKDYMRTTSDDSGDAFHEAVEILWDRLGDTVFDVDDAWDALRTPIAEPSGKENLCVDILGQTRSSSNRNTMGLSKAFGSKFVNKNYTVGEDRIQGGVNVKFVKLHEHRKVRYQLARVFSGVKGES